MIFRVPLKTDFDQNITDSICSIQ